MFIFKLFLKFLDLFLYFHASLDLFFYFHVSLDLFFHASLDLFSYFHASLDLFSYFHASLDLFFYFHVSLDLFLYFKTFFSFLCLYIHVRRKKRYDQLILEMYTRVELPFKVGGGGGGPVRHTFILNALILQLLLVVSGLIYMQEEIRVIN